MSAKINAGKIIRNGIEAEWSPRFLAPALHTLEFTPYVQL